MDRIDAAPEKVLTMKADRTIKELIIEAIDAGAPITTPLQDGAISGARLKKRPQPHTELTVGVSTELLSVSELFQWINGGEQPKYIPYVVWIPIAVHERTRAGNEPQGQGRESARS